jgi:hypothetical protein
MRCGQLLWVPFRCGVVPVFGRIVQRVLQAKDISAMRCLAIRMAVDTRFTFQLIWLLRLQNALENGHQMQALMKEAGVRYLQAVKRERRLKEEG